MLIDANPPECFVTNPMRITLYLHLNVFSSFFYKSACRNKLLEV